MKRHREDEIVTVPNGLSVFRLIFFAGFLWYVFHDRLDAAAFLFLLAWAIDGIDGFVARSMKQETTIGFYLDKIIDRTILIGGLLALILAGYVPVYGLLLLTKDIIVSPVLYIHGKKKEHIEDLGLPGKLMTFLQGVGILWLIFSFPYSLFFVVIVAVLGATIAIRHLTIVAKT